MDFRWTSQGGVLVDGTGDIATTLTATEELETMVATRLKAAINGWQLYQIGADLDSFKGISDRNQSEHQVPLRSHAICRLPNPLPPDAAIAALTC